MSVAVVIPAYNAEAFIRQAIDSVLAQSVPVDEILVVDDGSKDGTCAVVESYGGRVRLFRQKNQGPSVARNLGVSSSTAEHIAFLDADDAWHPEKIERQLAALKATPGAVLCYTSLLNFDGEAGWQEASQPIPLDALRAKLRLQNPQLVPSSVMVTREAFERTGGFDVALRGSEDWDMAIAMLEQGPFAIVEEPLTLYRCSTTGLSADPEKMFVETLKMLDRRLLQGLGPAERWIWRRRILSFHAYTACLNARALHKADRERHWMLYSVAVWPSPLWQPIRFKAFAVTIKNQLLGR